MPKADFERSSVPRQASCNLKRLALDPHEVHVLSRVDGRSSLEEIALVTGLGFGKVRRVVARLHELGAVDLLAAKREPPPEKASSPPPRKFSRRSLPALDPDALPRPGSRRMKAVVKRVILPTLIPKLASKRDHTSLAIGAREGFVLAQVDGLTSVADIAAITGLELEGLTEILGKLADAGAIELEAGESGRASVAPPPPRVSLAPKRPTPARQSKSPLPAASTKTQQPMKPVRKTPPPHRPSQRAILVPTPADEVCELDAETQARITGLHASLASATHYDFLGLDRGTDKKAIKRAFYALAATLHPDRHFRKKLGPLKQKLHEVFVRLTLSYETLVDPATRTDYDRRLPRSSVRSGDVVRAPAPPPVAASEPRPKTVPPASAVPSSASRDVFATRLSASHPNGPMAKAQAPASTSADRAAALRRFFDEKVGQAGRQRARVFVEAAEYALAKDDVLAAATHYRLALECCDVPEIRAAYEAVEEKAKARTYEISLKHANVAERAGRWEEAANRYSKAYGARPDARVAERLANALRLHGGDLRRAVKLAEEAVQKEPANVAYRVTLGEVCLDAGLLARARGEAERALSLAPKDESARALAARIAEAKSGKAAPEGAT